LFFIAKLALPDYQHAPFLLAEHTEFLSIARDISIKLLLPEGFIARRSSGSLAVPMTVPETAVHKNHLPMSREYNVRPPRQISSVLPEAVS
jgi:hypothetical protein